MPKYKYLTEAIPCGISKDKLTTKINEALNLRASEGWRLAKMEFCEWLGFCYLVFEKEADLLD